MFRSPMSARSDRRSRQGALVARVIVLILPAAGCVAYESRVDGSLSNSGGGASTSTTDTSAGGSNEDTSYIALPCSQDSHCGTGRCLQSRDDVEFFSRFWSDSDSTTGGPANGYCTMDCEVDSDCPGANSRCVDGGICLLTCEFGTPVADDILSSKSLDKCRGRDDLMCTPSTAGGALCLPVCGEDSECPADRGCDRRTGLCSDSPHSGESLGAGCTPDILNTSQDEDCCEGVCLEVADGEQTSHLCSTFCSLGGDIFSTTNCGGPEQGLCAFTPTFEEVGSSGLGDFAYCTGACEEHAQCHWEQGLFCFDVGVLDTVGKGYCFMAQSCPSGDECGADSECIATSYGPVCLERGYGSDDLLIPLGSGVAP